MFNPFIQAPPSDSKRDEILTDDELRIARENLRVAKPAPARADVGLKIGKLLIRIGQKLAKEDPELKRSMKNA